MYAIKRLQAGMRAAIAWRDEELAKAKVLGVLEFCQHERSNNASGVPGVQLQGGPFPA